MSDADARAKSMGRRYEWIAAVVLAASVLFLLLIVIPWAVLEDGWSSRGSFGDFFNAFFSALAFLGIVATLFLQKGELGLQRLVLGQQVEQLKLQREELALQREELKLTREELAKTAAAQQGTEAALKRQADQLEEAGKLGAISALTSAYSTLVDLHLRRGAIPDTTRLESEGIHWTHQDMWNHLRAQQSLIEALQSLVGRYADHRGDGKFELRRNA